MLSPQIKNPYKCKLSCTSGKVFRAVLAVPLFLAIYFFYQSSLNKNSFTYLDLGIKPDTSTILSKDFGFHLSIHPKSREERFVSFDDRLKIYLSNWYQPPCDSEKDMTDEKFGFVYDSDGPTKTLALNSHEDQTVMGMLDTHYNKEMPIALHEPSLRSCKNLDCQSAQRLLEFSKSHFGKSIVATDKGWKQELYPLLMFFGKISTAEALDLEYPYFSSYRQAASAKSVRKATKVIDCSQRAQRSMKHILNTGSKMHTFSPIIWDVYDMKTIALTVLDADVSWGAKLNKAVWRGKLSGKVEGATFEEKCNSNQRCQLIQKAAAAAALSSSSSSGSNIYHESLIDAGVTQQRNDFTLDKSLHLIKSPMTIEEQLKYRIIVIVEGDGYATNLPWALYSNSVVIMPTTPTKTSYLMEEKLTPWVHYIPCKDDFSDLEKKARWVLKHGKEAKTISERATIWIHDLYMSDEAIKENDEIATIIVKRYLDFFVNENA